MPTRQEVGIYLPLTTGIVLTTAQPATERDPNRALLSHVPGQRGLICH